MLAALLVATPGWTVEVAVGGAVNVPTPLTIRQDGEDDISLTAQYTTKPIDEVPYYNVRVGRGDLRGAWELELVHHKVYLRNPPPEVTRFSITHGYNLITFNRNVHLRWTDLRFGAGMVLTWPHVTVRGRALDETRGILGTGWHASGAAVQVAVARNRLWFEHWLTGIEVKLTGAWARVPVAGGSADVPNVALHVQLGGGYAFSGGR